MRADVAFARRSMAQARQIKYANRSRRHLVFKVGDQVLVRESHFKESAGSNLAQADRATSKLNPLYRGPFQVTEVISDVAYRLDLPEAMKRTHNAFHVSRLRPYLTTNDFPARAARLNIPETQMVGEEEHFIVKEFCGHRLLGKTPGHLQFLVQFTGVNQKNWDWAADLSRPPGMNEVSYLRQITRYATTNPRGTGPGKPPNPEQSQNLQQRLQQELQRATWAAGEMNQEDTQLRHDTDPIEVDFTASPVVAPRKTRRESQQALPRPSLAPARMPLIQRGGAARLAPLA
jgi:hypothetical protein